MRFTFSPVMWEKSGCFRSSPIPGLLVVQFSLFILSIPMVRFLVGVLICISLMTNGVCTPFHLFAYTLI